MLQGSSDDEKMKDLLSRNYKDQALFYLNAFWKSGMDKEAETVFKYTQQFAKLDLQKGAEGNALDELNAHRFLESNKETLTVLEMRDLLRKSGAIPANSRPKDFPITHFFMAHFKGDWHVLVNTLPGENAEEIARCQVLLKQIQDSIPELQKAESEAKAAAQEQHKQQKIYDDRTTDLKKKSEEGSVVAQNRAKNELAQHLASDPLPLSRAKITAEATAKKAERAVAKAQSMVNEIEEKLKELALKSGSSAGTLWWIDRDLHEAKQYLPTRKGGRSKDN
eukprot:TRINITY_DN185_c0_g1_i1.p1 TRINITY_DN185_c0_g1~~TRINITY_DN185_c0_g1_i1.p1  ORF type:complete len:291 (-),score=142.79 TRINITY_DN185_c0_g1_i1:79-915(-)